MIRSAAIGPHSSLPLFVFLVLGAHDVENTSSLDALAGSLAYMKLALCDLLVLTLHPSQSFLTLLLTFIPLDIIVDKLVLGCDVVCRGVAREGMVRFRRAV